MFVLAKRAPEVGFPDQHAVQQFDTQSPSAASRGGRLGGALVLVVVAAVAVLVHVGVLGAALAASAWASWGTNLVLVLIGVKIITVALHGVLGGVAFRHRGILCR